MPDQKNIIGGLLIIGASSIYNVYGSKIKKTFSKLKDNTEPNVESIKNKKEQVQSNDNQERVNSNDNQERVNLNDNQRLNENYNKSRTQENPLEQKSREELIFICKEFNDKLNLKNQEMQVIMQSYHKLQREVATLNNMVINQKLSN